MQHKMKSQQTTLSRSLFRIVELSERLLSLAVAIVSELREIRALLSIQNGQTIDTQLLTAEEAAEKLKVSFWTLVKLEQTGALRPIHLQGKRYYREADIKRSCS